MHLTARELVRSWRILAEDLQFHQYYYKKVRHTYGFIRTSVSDEAAALEYADAQYRATHAEILREADLFQVTADMCSLLHFACQSIPNERMQPESFLAPTGFMWLDDPIIHADVGEGREGRQIIRDVIFWNEIERTRSTDQPGMRFSFYGLSSNPDIKLDVEELIEGGMLNKNLHLPQLVFSGDLYVQYGEYIDDAFGWSDQVLHTMKWLMAFGIISRQRLAEIESPTIDRHTRRALERSGEPVPKIRVVSLRRRESSGHPPGTAGHRDWQQRWVVGGHWHRYRYGPGRQQIKTVWVFPFVKGPADKPLIIDDHVHRL